MNRLRSRLPGRRKGIGVGGESRASGKALQSWAPQSSGGPGPTLLKRAPPLGAKVSGNGEWGFRRPEFRVHPHQQLQPQGRCSHPLGPSSYCGPRHPHARGDDDSKSRPRARGPRHKPRAAALPHGASQGRRPSSSPAPGLRLPEYVIPIGRRLLEEPITGRGALWAGG